MKKVLIPHKYQKIALIVFVIDLVLVIAAYAGTIFSLDSSAYYNICTNRWYQLFLSWVMYLSVLGFVFSKESVEDELIVWCRLRSVAITAIVGVAAILLMDLAQSCLSGEKYEALKLWRQTKFWNGNFQLWLLVLYAVIFKLFVKHYSFDEDEE